MTRIISPIIFLVSGFARAQTAWYLGWLTPNITLDLYRSAKLQTINAEHFVGKFRTLIQPNSVRLV